MTSLGGLLRQNLRLQLILAVAAVHAVLMLLFVWDLTQRQKSMLLDHQAAQASAMAQTITASAAGWVAASDLSGLQEIIEAQRPHPDLEYAMVLDSHGRVLAHTDQARIGQFVRDLPAAAKLAVLQRSALLVDVANPIVLAGRPLGWVRLGMGQRGTGAELGRITRNGVLYALGAIVIGTVIAALMGARLTARIYAIRAVSQAVRAGDREVRVQPAGEDEVGQLAGDFNGMLDSLSLKEREIAQLNAGLERLVGERTKELAEALDLNRNLVETAALGILAFEAGGQCVLANEFASRIIGGTVEQLRSQNFRQIDSWSQSGLRAAAEQALATGLPQRVEIGIITSFQRNVVLDCSLSRFEARGLTHLLLTFADTTRRKRAEEDLARAQQLLRLVLDTIPIGVFWKDRESRFLGCNLHAARDAGLAAPEQIIGRTDFELAWSALADAYQADDRAVMEAASAKTGIEEKIVHPGGQVQWVRMNKLPLCHASGVVFGVLGTYEDISLRKRMEAEQQKLLDELVRSNADLEQFAYVASHDLKSPLRAIESLAGWLQEDLEPVLTSQSREHLRLLRQRTDRMERLLNDLLAYARAGRMPVDLMATDVTRLVRDMGGLINLPEGFVLRQEGALPVFTTASTPLNTVLTNLVNNAVKHHDRKAGVIEVSAREDGDWYEFSVADDGRGIPPEFHERIWGMFQTLRPRDEVEGSGIGLALVQRIVTRYGGRVSVACRQPRGSLFRFTWPKTIPTQ